MNRSTGNTTPRLFVSAALREGVEIAASAEQAHYLATVLRRATGDRVRLFNGTDGEWAAHLTVARRDRVSLTVKNQLRAQAPEAGPWLLFALLKRDATDLVVRQAVELGASRLLPVITERTNAARVNGERLRAIAIEAAEQSERLTVPCIDPPAPLDAVLANWPDGRRLFVALERLGGPRHGPAQIRHGPARPGHQQQRDDAPDGPTRSGHDEDGARSHDGKTQPGHDGGSQPDHDQEATALLIGPEGGFTPEEREHLHRLGFVTPISLGPFVLRAETAAAAGLALLPGMGWAEYVRST